MKMQNTSIRLKEIMTMRNLRQIDILEMTKPYCEKYGIKMNKSDISQYVSGKVEPSQDKLVVLGMALNVSEAWLMGFDVPIEHSSSQNMTPIIMHYYNSLNDIGKQEATKRIEELTHLQRYKKDPHMTINAAHASVPEGLKQFEEDITNSDSF